MLYMLWDLGLKIGHSTRSITEAITAGRDDQTVMTSFLEMRLAAKRPYGKNCQRHGA